ncbi:membrane hypothetical protein [Tenacibaculum sp. 190524A05c]|uniref:Uncharacterized protein n=1 Tax=Tenacibaculum platacis TaxID=3137852 RepID=A0ABP1EP63_9FLAO
MLFDDLIYFLLYTFRIFFFGSFWIYAIIYYCCEKISTNKRPLKLIDEKILKSIPKIGVIWILVYLLLILIIGKYIYLTLGLLFIYCILIWLFKTRHVKEKLLYRIVLSLLFYISFETFDLLAIIISKGSIPKTWLSINISSLTVLGNLGIRFFFFIVIITLYYTLQSFFKKLFE